MDYVKKLKTKIQELFTFYIKPRNILHLFARYDENVLTDRDIEKVKAVTDRDGDTAGAQELLDRLCIYENFFECLMKVMNDREVKLGHAAEKMEKKKLELDEGISPEEAEDVEGKTKLADENQQLKAELSRKDQELSKLRKEKEWDDQITRLIDWVAFLKEQGILMTVGKRTRRDDLDLFHDSAKKRRLEDTLSIGNCAKRLTRPINTWCRCGHCAVLPHFKEEDLLCCHEVAEAKQLLSTQKPCVTLRGFFRDTILDKELLKETFESWTMDLLFDPPQTRNWRYAAYAVFTRWIYGVLGAGNRKITPACAVACIHSQFPFQG